MKSDAALKKKKKGDLSPSTIRRRESTKVVGPHTVNFQVTRKQDGRSITMVVKSGGKTDVVTHQFIHKDKKQLPHYEIKYLNKKYRKKK